MAAEVLIISHKVTRVRWPRVGSGALQNKSTHFLAECCMRRLNQASFVLLCLCC